MLGDKQEGRPHKCSAFVVYGCINILGQDNSHYETTFQRGGLLEVEFERKGATQDQHKGETHKVENLESSQYLEPQEGDEEEDKHSLSKSPKHGQTTDDTSSPLTKADFRLWYNINKNANWLV